MNQPQTAVRLAIALAFLSVAAVAQGGYRRTLPLPAPGFVPVAMGDYTDDCHGHAILIHNQQAYLAFSPASHSSMTLVAAGWQVNGVATLPQPGTYDADRLLGIGPAGLTFGQYDGEGVFSWSVLSAGNWANGVAIECAGSTNSALVVGLAANRTTLGVAGVSGGVVGGQLWVNQGATVRQFVLFDWNQDGAMEVGVLTASSLRILDTTLTPLVTLPGGGGAIARLRNAGGADNLAWVRPAGRGNHDLVVLSPGGASAPLRLALPLATGVNDTFPLVGIAGSDVNGDGRDDVAIAQNATSQIVVLCRQAGSTPFLVPSVAVPGMIEITDYADDESAAGTLASTPLFGHFNGDEYADLLLTSVAGRVFIAANTTDDMPGLDDDGFMLTPMDSGPGTLEIRFTVPPLTEYRAIQIVVWREEAGLIEWTPQEGWGLDVVPYSNTWHALAEATGGSLEPRQEVTLDLNGELNRTVWAYESGERRVQPHLWIEMRFITIAGGPSSPASCCGLTLRNDYIPVPGAAPSLSEPFMARLNTHLVGEHVDGDPPVEPRRIMGRQGLVGGIVPVVGIPSCSDGTKPEEGPPTQGGDASPAHSN